MAHFHGSVSGKHVHGDGSWGSAPTIGAIAQGATSLVFAHTGGGTHYRTYATGGAAGSWLSLGASPVTVTGLSANALYTIELSSDGSTVASAQNTGTTNPASGADGITAGPPVYTSSAVFYVPVRMVSGLWANNGVTPSVPPGSEAWLPSIRQPFGYLDPRDGKFYCDPIWYRAFEYAFETRLGGRGAPSVPDVVSTVAATQETAAAASATIAEVAQQTQANAEALFVVREVVQGGALDGAEQIPGVDLR